MNKEIKQMEKDIRNGKIYSSELKDLKRDILKLKLLNTLRGFYPYILSTGLISLGVFSCMKLGGKKYLSTEYNFDSYGNDKKIYEYKNDTNEINGTVTYMGKWEPIEDGTYERTIKRYSTNRIKPEMVKNAITNENSIKSLNEMLGEPILVTKEIGKNLTEEEVNAEEHIEAVMYSVDKNEYIKFEMTGANRFSTGISGLALIVMLNWLISLIRNNESNYSYFKENRDINDEYEQELNVLYNKYNKNKKLIRTDFTPPRM